MPISFLLFVTLIPAYAISYLPCQRALSGDIFYPARNTHGRILAENQIVVRGDLQAHWETGMEDQTAWGILDDQTYRHLSANTYDALHVFRPGDEVFILENESAIVRVSGFFGETRDEREVNIGGRIIPTRPNQPHLYENPNLSTLSVRDKELIRHFEKPSKAIAIVNLNSKQLADYDKNFEAKLERYAEHFRDPARFIPIGSGRTQEREMFEAVHYGVPEMRADRRVRLLTDEGPLPLLPGDHFQLISSDDRNVGEVKIQNFPASLDEKEAEILARSNRGIVFRRSNTTRWAKTDF